MTTVTVVKPWDGLASAESFHVHRKGCRDLKHRKYVLVDAFDVVAETERDVVLDTYDPQCFGFDPDTDEYLAYAYDFKFYPCTGLKEE